MEREELKAIALAKLTDAILLFEYGRHSNSYYLFGYAAEIALKARIARLFRPDTIPDRKFVNEVYTHKLASLIGLAGLAEELNKRKRESLVFESHWSTVSNWDEGSRYDIIDVFTATAMKNAMTDPEQGIFPWLQSRW